MTSLYQVIIKLYFFVVWVASLFNTKAKLFVDGRKKLLCKLKNSISTEKERIWFHFASLGEFEQGRTVLESLKLDYKEHEIIVTFFSPSGYEIRKGYPGVKVFYLPMDSKENAKKFIQIVNPSIAIFTKYEFWHFYFLELKKNQIPLFLISSIFRPTQIFFKWYGGFYKKMLSCVTHFFVQNKESSDLLSSIGFKNVSLTGDTRFDRVYENSLISKSLPQIEIFLNGAQTLVAGSTWPQDEILLSVLPSKYPNWKFVLAPHEIDEKHINKIEGLFKGNCIKYSDVNNKQMASWNVENVVQVLIIDNIGMLSSLYQFGKIAYIGGGFGAGIHNTLEAAAFGLPVIFGSKFDKFREAKDLIQIGAAKSISGEKELIEAFDFFISNEKSSAEAKKYVAENKGATEIILNFIEPYLKNKNL